MLRAGGGLFTGPQAILDDFYGGNIAPTVDLLDWVPSSGDAASSADLGWTVGNAVETIFDPGGDLVFIGTYLTCGSASPMAPGATYCRPDGLSASPIGASAMETGGLSGVEER